MPENVLHYINIRTGELAEEDPRDLLARRACSDPLRPWVWPSWTRFRRCDGTLAGAGAGEGSSAGGGEGSSSGASAKAGAEITPMEVLSSNMMFRTRDGTLVPSGGARADVASGSGGGAGAGAGSSSVANAGASARKSVQPEVLPRVMRSRAPGAPPRYIRRTRGEGAGAGAGVASGSEVDAGSSAGGGDGSATGGGEGSATGGG